MLGATCTVGAALQLALLALPAVVLGLGLYGSEFALPSGRIVAGAVASLPLVVLLTRVLLGRLARHAGLWVPVCLLAASTQLAAHLHLRAELWDERSTRLAQLLAAGLVASTVLATLAVERLRHAPHAWRAGLPGALLLAALYFAAERLDPHAPLLGSAALCLLGLGSGVPVERPEASRAERTARTRARAGWIWLAAMALSFPVWARGLQGGWGAPLAAGLVAAALGAAWNGRRSAPVPAGPKGLLLGALVLACLAERWSAGALITVPAGLVLGACLVEVPGRRGLPPALSTALLVTLGWLMAHALTGNLAAAPARALFGLPLLLTLFPRRGAALPASGADEVRDPAAHP